jgi:hypothetical protein
MPLYAYAVKACKAGAMCELLDEVLPGRMLKQRSCSAMTIMQPKDNKVKRMYTGAKQLPR